MSTKTQVCDKFITNSYQIYGKIYARFMLNLCQIYGITLKALEIRSITYGEREMGDLSKGKKVQINEQWISVGRCHSQLVGSLIDFTKKTLRLQQACCKNDSSGETCPI